MSVLPIESKQRATAYELSDLGNAERFAARHGTDVRLIGKKWFVWDGRRWAADAVRAVDRKAKETVRSIWSEASKAESVARKRDIAKHAISSARNASIKAMLERAGAEPGVAITPGDLDQGPFGLTVKNGTLDLQTGILGPHERAHLCTKYAPVPYDPSAACPRWLAFLHRILAGDAEIIAYVQRAVGYTLTADVRERCLHLLHGSGANGKSVFLETLARMMGDYALQADFATFLDKKGDGPRNDLARLAGARMVRSSEVGEGKQLNEAFIKAITGNETISARFLYTEPFEFDPTFKIWLAANHKPVIRGTDPAIWDRVRLIPFEVTIPKADRDETLGTTLRAELPGILTWAVQGCLSWLEGGLRPPAKVLAATNTYRAESDVLGSFLDEACISGNGSRVLSGELYGAYKRWAFGSREVVLSQTDFNRQLEERGVGSIKSGGFKYKAGITLRHDTQQNETSEVRYEKGH